jgi:hypothetical protein
MDRKEFRVLMKNCFLAEKNTVEAKAWLEKHYLDSASAKSTVEKWLAKLKLGKMCIEVDARSGRPKEAVTDEDIKKVHKIYLNDRKVKLIEIAETLKISKKRVGHIVQCACIFGHAKAVFKVTAVLSHNRSKSTTC